MALYFFVMYVLGGAFGTSILGMLSDYFAKQAMVDAGLSVVSAAMIPEQFKAIGLRSAFFAVPVVSLVMAGVLWMASRTVTADMERLQRWMRESSDKNVPRVSTNVAAIDEV